MPMRNSLSSTRSKLEGIYQLDVVVKAFGERELQVSFKLFTS